MYGRCILSWGRCQKILTLKVLLSCCEVSSKEKYKYGGFIWVAKYINNLKSSKSSSSRISYVMLIIIQQQYIFLILSHLKNMSSNTKFIKP